MVFLFTKIEHPSLFQELGSPDADHVLACQLFLIEEVLQAHGVHWAQRTTNGVMAIFEGGDSAQAALALQKEFQEQVWRLFGKAEVAVVLHAGQADRFGQTYVGPEIKHALKLLEAAWGGQVLLTLPAVHFVALPPGGRLLDLGIQFLKDLSPPRVVYALQHESLPPRENFPLRSLRGYPQNFIPQASPFFGREEEIKEIGEILTRSNTRLITLRGPGGFGKTRLAFQASAEVVGAFKDGVFWVSLAPLLTDQLIVGAIANAIKFFFYGVEDAKDQLLSHLKEKEMLFVLDNFEHIIDGAKLVAEILKAAPDVKILATSRESLRIEGEKLFEVRGLRYPAEGQPDDLEAFSAVQLFLKSGRRVKPDFALKPEDRPWMLKICRLLEGMPLGLELSATWLGTLSTQDIAEKIMSSNDFLATSMPHLPPRHRSLRAVFEYSWILLSEPQKKILRAISVFKGGFHEDAARKVAGATDTLLTSLGNKSLVHQRPDGRFEIHELLKYYAKEKLYDSNPEKEKILDAHCAYYARLLHQMESRLSGASQKKVLQDLVEEMGNIREGWKRATEKLLHKEMEGYLDCLFAIYETKGWYQEAKESFWKAAEHLQEKFPNPSSRHRPITILLARVISRWAAFENDLGKPLVAQKLFEESLRLFASASAVKLSGFALSGLGIVLQTQGDYEAAKTQYEKSLKVFRQAKDRRGIAWVMNHLGHIASRMGHSEQAKSFVRQSLAFSEKKQDHRAMGYSYNLMGEALTELGHYEQAKTYYQKALSAYLESGERKGLSWSFANLGKAADVLGDYAGARQMYQESMAISRDLGDIRGVAWTKNLLGSICWELGEYNDAYQLYGEGLNLYREVGDLRGQAWTLDMTANLQLARREDKDAERLYYEAYALLTQEGINSQNKAWHLYHMGTLHLFHGRSAQAKQEFLKSFQLFEKLGDALGKTAALIQLGEVTCDLKGLSEAEVFFRRAAEVAIESHLKPFLPDVLVGMARLLKLQDQEQKAIGFLMVALAQPTCRRQTKDRVVVLALDLKSQFSSEEVEGIQRWAQAASIEDVAAAWIYSQSLTPSRRKGKGKLKKQAKRKPKKAKKTKKK